MRTAWQLKWPETPRRAALQIAGATIAVALAGGVLAWALDREDFPTLGQGVWWSLQTVTTVGYGDVVPERAEGRVIGAFVMLTGVAFIAVVTAAVTAELIESARRRRRPAATGPVAATDDYEITVRGHVTPALLSRFENVSSDVGLEIVEVRRVPARDAPGAITPAPADGAADPPRR